MTNEEELVRMFAEVGSFDHLVVTSGFPRGAPIASIDLDEVRALVEVLLIGAISLAPTRINVVSPGWVETPIWDALAGEGKTAMWEQMAGRLPAGRISKPADLASAYAFLMESEFTTGITLPVDGGHSLI